MLSHFKYFSPMITACALTVFLFAGFVTDGTAPSCQGNGKNAILGKISFLQPGIAGA